jgi:hypothetical protein
MKRQLSLASLKNSSKNACQAQGEEIRMRESPSGDKTWPPGSCPACAAFLLRSRDFYRSAAPLIDQQRDWSIA